MTPGKGILVTHIYVDLGCIPGEVCSALCCRGLGKWGDSSICATAGFYI